jgi:hypothetical protein
MSDALPFERSKKQVARRVACRRASLLFAYDVLHAPRRRLRSQGCPRLPPIGVSEV